MVLTTFSDVTASNVNGIINHSKVSKICHVSDFGNSPIFGNFFVDHMFGLLFKITWTRILDTTVMTVF